MAAVAPINSVSTTLPPGPSSPPSTNPQWEGDKMFNIYIYDYCRKRGYVKTANELLEEAELAPDSSPPIDAKQGLLFEWWSVFWVLFSAKSSGTGTEEALLYTQHQANQAAQRQSAQRMQGGQMPAGRFINGQRHAIGPNGAMPNGVAAGLPQTTLQVGGQPPAPFQMGGIPTNQMNGVGGPSAVPGAAAPQPPNFQQAIPGQRPNMAPQRQGGLPFQSPTMADSPQNAGIVPGQQQMGQPVMGQLGPSPNMNALNRSMPPPNGVQGVQGMPQTGMAPNAGTPTPTMQNAGRPPSRTATPGQINPMMHASPSMANRQPPVPGPQQMDLLNAEIGRLGATGQLNAVKQEVGIPVDKDLSQMSIEEKTRIIQWSRQRSRSVKPGQPGPNAVAGPSGINASMQPPNQRIQPQQAQGARPNKRNSTSPGEEHGDLPSSDSSPPDRKRPRTSPEQTPLQPLNYPQGPQGAPGQPQIPNGMMRGPMPGQMAGFPPGMGNIGSPGMNMQPMGQQMVGAQHMANAMSPGMNHQVMTNQMREYQYRQNMQGLHKNPQGTVMPGAGSPASAEMSFNPTGAPNQAPPPFTTALNNRLPQPQNKSMMPPPSPALNGVQKDQNGQMKDVKPMAAVNGHPDGSPRNAPMVGQSPANPQTAASGTTAPPTPIPPPSQVMTESSSSAMLNPPPPVMGPTGSGPELFSTDFIQSVASSLDEFGSDMFRGDTGDINFERDFGQWFNPDDVGLDLK